MGENIAYARAVAEVGVDAAEGTAWGGAGVAEVMQFHRAAAIAEVLGVVADVLSTIGDVAFIVWVGYQLNGAFKAEKDEVKRFGYLYGIMWQSLDERDHIRTYNAPGITYSADELRDAFVAGVAEGWEKAKEVEIHNAIKLWVASSAVESGLGVWAAAHEVITAIYCKSENTQLRYQLDWPTPFPYTGLVGLYLSNQQ